MATLNAVNFHAQYSKSGIKVFFGELLKTKSVINLYLGSIVCTTVAVAINQMNRNLVQAAQNLF